MQKLIEEWKKEIHWMKFHLKKPVLDHYRKHINMIQHLEIDFFCYSLHTQFNHEILETKYITCIYKISHELFG